MVKFLEERWNISLDSQEEKLQFLNIQFEIA